MEVTVVCKKLVKPTCPTPEKLRTLQISSLDQLNFPLYVSVILYYTADGGGGTSSDQRKRRLEESLANVLSLYYPLAGRYMSDKYMVDCNDQGAEVLEAKVNCKLSELLQRGNNIHVQELNHLLPFGIESPTTPLLIIQLNVFDCGGIAIGFTCTHRIMDGASISQFICGWSVACCQGIDKVHRPSFQVAYSLLPTLKQEELPVINYLFRKKEGVRFMTKRFLFDEEAITTLKATASSDKCQSKFSRSQVVTTLIWIAITRTCQATNKGNLRPCLLSQSANMRDKLFRIPTPPNSIGNFVINCIAKFAPTDDKINLDFAEMVRLLRDSVTSTFNKCAEFTSGDDIVAGVVDSWNERVCGDDVDVCKISSWCNQPYYEADFGWGKPIWISSSHIPTDKLTLMLDTKDKKGVEAWVSLDENDMPLFQEILEMALTIT